MYNSTLTSTPPDSRLSVDAQACYNLVPASKAENLLLPDSNVVTYIIRMENSDRDIEPLKHISPVTYVLENKGFKACAKENINNPMGDLFHANKTILDLEKDNPAPVFILEDDCELLSDKPEDYKACVDFMNENNSVDSIALGCQPMVSWSVNSKFARVYYGSETHAMLYSQTGRKKILDGIEYYTESRAYLVNHDFYVFRWLYIYAPIKPLAGQLHPMTENATYWTLLGDGGKVLRDECKCEKSAKNCAECLHKNIAIGGQNGILVAGAFLGAVTVGAVVTRSPPVRAVFGGLVLLLALYCIERGTVAAVDRYKQQQYATAIESL